MRHDRYFMRKLPFVIIALSLCVSFSSRKHRAFLDEWSSTGVITPTFVRDEINELTIYNEQEKFEPFFSKMEKLIFEGDGKISILHMGGSHVQGGFLTDRLRHDFSSLCYGVKGERGFLFPYKLAGTNSPSTIKCNWKGNWSGCRSSVSNHDCDWGVSGISAQTSDSVASFELMVEDVDSTLFDANRIIVYYTGNGSYDLLPDSNMLVTSIESYPDDGYDIFTFARNYDSFRFTVSKCSEGPATFILQGIYLGDDTKTGISYHAIGVNGAGTYSYLRASLFESQVMTIRPDIVFFGIGVNDANVPESDFDQKAFEERYERLMQMIRKSNPDVAFVFITNNDTYYQKRFPNRNAYKVQEAMHRLAEKHDAAVYDLFAIMGGLGSIDDWRDADLAAKDRIHLTRKGYYLQADMMFDAFKRAFGDYLQSKYDKN